MAVENLKLWEIRTGLGINKRLSPDRLLEGQCVDSLNFILEHGDWRARPGTSRLTATALQAAKPVVGLYDFTKRDGRRFLLAGCNGKLYVATGGATAFNDLGVASKSNLPSWECTPTFPPEFEGFPIKDAVYFGNSSRDTAYRFDGTLISNLDPPWPPPAAPTLAAISWPVTYMQTLADWGTGPTAGVGGTRWTRALDSTTFYKGTGCIKITATTSAAVGDYIIWDMNGSNDAVGNRGTKDWSLTDLIVFWVKGDKSGLLFSFQISEDKSTWLKMPTVNIERANQWQQVVWRVSDVDAGSRNAIRYLRFVCELAATAFNVWIDHLYIAGGFTLPEIYQHRIAYYDLTNGEESNPSPESLVVQTISPNAKTNAEAACGMRINIPGTGDRCEDGSTKLQVRLYRKGGSYNSLWKRVPTTYRASAGTASWQASMTAPTAGVTRVVYDLTPDLSLGAEMPSPHGHPRFARFLKEYHSRMAWVYDHHESEANFGRWGAAVSAGTERLTMTTINNGGPVVGALLYPTTTGTGASLQAALQKKVGGTFVNMRSGNLASSQITANKWNLLLFATGIGDNYVKTTPTGTYRLRVISSGGTGPALATSDGTKISFRGLMDVRNRLWISNRYDPETIAAADIYSSSVSEDQGGYIDLPIRRITALGKYGDDLLIFGDNRAYLLLGDTPEDFRWPRISARVGCTAARSYVYAESQAYWFGNGHFWTFDGQRLYAIDEPHENGGSDIRPLLDALSSTYTPNIVGSYDPKNRYVYWNYTESGATNNRTFVYDLKTKGFLRFSGINAFCWRSRVTEQDTIFGDYSGHVWKHDRTDGKHMDHTSAIALSYETNHSALNTLDEEKKAVFLMLQGDGTSRSAAFTFKLMLDGTLSSSQVTNNLQGTGVQFTKRGKDFSPESSRGRYMGIRFTGTAATGTEATRIRHLGIWLERAQPQE